MNPRIPVFAILLVVSVVQAATTKQPGIREPLSPNSRPETVEQAVAASLEDLLEDARSFFESTGPRSVRAILQSPVAGRTSGTVSRSKLSAATVKLQEQASATLADLSTVMRGAQERLGRMPRADTRRQYEQLMAEARELSAAVSGYSNHFKQATRVDIGQWISYDLPALADQRDKSGKVPAPSKTGAKGQSISGFLVY